MMPSVEGAWYNRGITVLFMMAYLAIAFNFVRFLSIWVATNHLLSRLSWHPLLMGYRMPDPETDPVLGRLQLDISSPIPTFTTLTKSVGQARIFWQIIQKFNARLSSKINPVHIKTAQSALSDAYHFDASGEWQQAFDARNKVRSKLVELSYEVAAIVRKQWITELQGKSQQSPSVPMINQAHLAEIEQIIATNSASNSDLPREIMERGELFLVSRLIGYLQYVMAQMQNLVFFVTAGLLLMLAAMLSYPFQPMSPLMIFNWITILTVVVVTMLVFIQMNRNPALSLLSGTKPGELNWNSRFILQVVIHGLLPLLAIAGAQFSDSLRELMMMLGISMGATPH